MRCPFCLEEIHDQAVKCPHCQRLLVRKPGWRKDREAQAVGARRGGAPRQPPGRPWTRPPDPPRAARTAPADGRGRDRGRSTLLSILVLLLLVVAVATAFVVGRSSGDAPQTTVIDAGDAEAVAALEALAEERRQEIERLKDRLEEALAEPRPDEKELRDALEVCYQAFQIVIEREGTLFTANDGSLRRFVTLANRCLGPTGHGIETVI